MLCVGRFRAGGVSRQQGADGEASSPSYDDRSTRTLVTRALSQPVDNRAKTL